MTIQQELESVNEQIANIQSLIGFMETTLSLTREDNLFQDRKSLLNQQSLEQQRLLRGSQFL